MAFLLLIGVLLQVQNQHRTVVYDRPIDQAYRLRITVTYSSKTPGACCSTRLRLLLVDRSNANRYWEIAALSDDDEIAFRVERADARTVVLSRRDPDYGADLGSVKLFFDTRSRRLLKRIDFATSRELVFANDTEARRTLRVSAGGLKTLRERRIFAADYDDDPALPEPFVTHPLPQSTYQEFARVRPRRVQDGYTPQGTRIEERIGASQVEDGGLWFGKAFYDGEGTTGVGALGYLDLTGRYTFLRIPELVDWSVLGFLVDRDTLWAGLVDYGEGAAGSGGLLQYDRNTGHVRLQLVPDVIHSIALADGAVFLGTTHGLYVIRDGRLTRYRAEPGLNGQFVVVSESM